MKNPRRNRLLVWLIAGMTFIGAYLLVRLPGAYSAILSDESNSVYQKVMFEIGIFVFVLLILFLGAYYIFHFWERKDVTAQNVLAISSLMLITLGLSVFLINLSPYAMPLILVPLILTFITDRRTAEFMAVLITLLIIPFSTGTPAVIFMSLFTGILSSILASKINQRREFPVLGLALALSNLVLLFVFSSVTGAGFVLEQFLKDALFSSIATFLCVIAAIGLLPFFETISGIISNFELMDLANPTNKLLKRLMVEAPGTYYHSIMVGNLAEAAAEKVGANANLARVAAYYHDIGKLKDPIFFMENQHGENIHDTLDPYESVAVITRHTADGVKLGEKYRLPPQIIEIIGEHHGNTLVAWFYRKACDMAQEGELVDPENFRYKASKPTSKESAIIMLADSVEAATKALGDKSLEKIRERVEQVVSGKISDGQLDECPLSLRDIGEIKKQFEESIHAYYHKRDEYPGTGKTSQEAAAALQTEK